MMKTKRTTDRLELFVWPGLAWIAAWNFAVAPSASSKKPKKKAPGRRTASIIPFPVERVTQGSLQPGEAKVIVLPKSA